MIFCHLRLGDCDSKSRRPRAVKWDHEILTKRLYSPATSRHVWLHFGHVSSHHVWSKWSWEISWICIIRTWSPWDFVTFVPLWMSHNDKPLWEQRVIVSLKCWELFVMVFVKIPWQLKWTKVSWRGYVCDRWLSFFKLLRLKCSCRRSPDMVCSCCEANEYRVETNLYRVSNLVSF